MCSEQVTNIVFINCITQLFNSTLPVIRRIMPTSIPYVVCDQLRGCRFRYKYPNVYTAVRNIYSDKLETTTTINYDNTKNYSTMPLKLPQKLIKNIIPLNFELKLNMLINFAYIWYVKTCTYGIVILT